MTTAVLLLGYGGPDTLDDIPAYLLDIRGGRETPQHLIDEITDHYRHIGGRSPLLDITNSLAARLSHAVELPVYVGMRHWRPWIKDAVACMAADGVQRFVAICLAPQYSTLSIVPYRRRLGEALAACEAEFDVHFVESWHERPEFVAGVAANVRAALERFPADSRGAVPVLFTAHSLPQFILERGDPYVDQLQETAALVAEQAGLARDRWQLAFQSASQTGMPWLGPDVREVVAVLAEQGHRQMLVAPVGFIMEHVEILYDLDVELQQVAQGLDVHLERTVMLNDGPALVATLAALVRSAL